MGFLADDVTLVFARMHHVACVVMPVAWHVAALGMRFYTGTMFPAEYRNVAFVARKGSWNRTKKFGFDVVTVRACCRARPVRRAHRGARARPHTTG